MGVDTLVVEKSARVGDVWRHRYNNLTLHNEVVANHLPYLPFPTTWPVWLPKDMLASWLEGYAEFLELNVWTSTEVRYYSSYYQRRIVATRAYWKSDKSHLHALYRRRWHSSDTDEFWQ